MLLGSERDLSVSDKAPLTELRRATTYRKKWSSCRDFFISFYLAMMNISIYYKMSILNLYFISQLHGGDQIFFIEGS